MQSSNKQRWIQKKEMLELHTVWLTVSPSVENSGFSLHNWPLSFYSERSSLHTLHIYDTCNHDDLLLMFSNVLPSNCVTCHWPVTVQFSGWATAVPEIKFTTLSTRDWFESNSCLSLCFRIFTHSAPVHLNSFSSVPYQKASIIVE